MNTLPEAWHLCVEKNNSAPFILLDGAIQHQIGAKLARDAGGAYSFFANESAAAQALGPWLMTAQRAAALGIDGSARGVNWIDSSVSFAHTREHLLLWMRGPDPASREWLRLADGRSLQALSTVWSAAQWQAFCRPWRAWCYANRDGNSLLLSLPAKPDFDASPLTLLDAGQESALTLACLPDQLLHELKGHITPHASLKRSREQRHAIAQAIVGQARALGYETEHDLRQLIAWALRKGVTAPECMSDVSAVQQALRGEALSLALDQDVGGEGGSQ